MAAVAAGGLLGKGRDISLAALQRHDPYITCIVDVASQVALYTFGHRANEWVRADAAGRADPGWAGTGGLDSGRRSR
jgi:mRNA-decapping enzyme 1B